jgi:hypothetical protein
LCRAFGADLAETANFAAYGIAPEKPNLKFNNSILSPSASQAQNPFFSG